MQLIGFKKPILQSQGLYDAFLIPKAAYQFWSTAFTKDSCLVHVQEQFSAQNFSVHTLCCWWLAVKQVPVETLFHSSSSRLCLGFTPVNHDIKSSY